MKDLSVSQGYLYGTIVECILYGFNTALFIAYLFVLDSKGRSSKIVKYSVYLMFALSTAHLALTIRSLDDGFFGQSGPLDFYFATTVLGGRIPNKFLYGATLVIGDALLIYRVWLIYGKSWKAILLPTLSLLGTLVCIIVNIWEFSRRKPGQTITQITLSPTAPAMFILPFVTNVLITVLIVFRINQARIAAGQLSTSSAGSDDAIYEKVIWGVVESCVIYPLFLLSAIVMYFLKTTAMALITGSLVQVVAIVPTLMWLQVILGRSQYDSAAQAGGFSTDVMTTHISFRGIEFRTRTRQDVNESGVSGITMSQLRGERELESQSVISAK